MTNFGKGHDRQIKEKRMQKRVFIVSIFIPEKYMFRVCFESPFTRMISNLKYKCPPPPRLAGNSRFARHLMDIQSVRKGAKFFFSFSFSRAVWGV